MEQWIPKYWWLVWVAFGVLIAFRVHRRGGTEHVLRRIIFAAFPASDPASTSGSRVTGRSAILVALGVLAVSLAYLWFIESR